MVGDSVSSVSSASGDPSAAVAVPTNSPVHYFLKVTGATGDVTDRAHKGWFAVDGFDIGVSTPFADPAGTEVTGRTQFSALSVDIHSITGVSTLLEDELTNKNITSVELVGVVQEFRFTSPHAFIRLEVLDRESHKIVWNLEGESPNSLAWGGWSYNTLKPGDELSLTVYPLRSGAPGGAWHPARSKFKNGLPIVATH